VHGCRNCFWRSAPGFDRKKTYDKRKIKDEIHFTRVIIKLRENEGKISAPELSQSQRMTMAQESYQLAVSVQDL
jgi:hypothetical protein